MCPIAIRELPVGARQKATVHHITSEQRTERFSSRLRRARPIQRTRVLTARSEQEWYRRGI